MKGSEQPRARAKMPVALGSGFLRATRETWSSCRPAITKVDIASCKPAREDRTCEVHGDVSTSCAARDVDLNHITTLRKFEWIEALKDITDMLMLSDEETQRFLTKASTVERLFVNPADFGDRPSRSS